MFQFTRTTLINSDHDALSGKAKFSGENNVFKVLREGTFLKDGVISVFKRIGQNGILSKAEVTPPTKGSNEEFYRISIQLRQVGNQTSVYANAASVHKIKPIHIEFKVGSSDNAGTVCDNIVKAVRFYQQNLYPFITASKITGDKVVIKGADEYVFFDKVDVEKLTSATVSVYPDDQNIYTKVSSAVITNGKEGFGTYLNLTKNLRLPTLEATRFGSPTQEELPVMGSLYNQYTLTYKRDRGIMGGSVVGQETTSVTTHVFFVKQDLAGAFEQAMTQAGLTITNFEEGISGDAAKPVVVIPANQSVAKNSKSLLVFTADGIEKLSGGKWEVQSATDKALISFEGNVINVGEATVDDLMVKVTYDGVTSEAVKVSITGI